MKREEKTGTIGTLDMYYKENESDTLYAGLIRQWAEKWEATYTTSKLRSLNAEDVHVATGGSMSYGDMLDYQDDREKRPFTLHHEYSVAVQLKNGRTIPGTVGNDCAKEMYAILALYNGRDNGHSDLLNQAGYEFDALALSVYVAEQKRISDVFDAVYGVEYD